jgi:hypothetical protein
MMKITPTDSTISSDAVEGSTIELRVKRQPDETHPSTASPRWRPVTRKRKMQIGYARATLANQVAVLAGQLLLGKQAVAVRDIPLSGPIRLGTMVVNV